MYHKRMKGTIGAAVGFAADRQGSGIAYVRLGSPQAQRVLRVAFTVKRYPALRGREVGYAALRAAASALRARGVKAVQFAVEDAALIEDLREHRDLPAALTLSYVALRCTLNQFDRYELTDAPQDESDLTARARGELALHVAA